MIGNFAEKIRKFFSKSGYTCDRCQKEVFAYPKTRLCADCFAALEKNEKYVCDKCGRKTRSEGVCLECKRELPEFSKGYSPFVYANYAASLVNRFKKGNRHFAYFFADEMVKYLGSALNEKRQFLVVSVPLTAEKRRVRGYNQADELAKAVSERLGVEYGSDVLVKTRETEKQKERSAKERRENVRGAYRVAKRVAVRNRKILLIDDIMTTGATGSECARVLKNAGASEVVFLTAASAREKN